MKIISPALIPAVLFCSFLFFISNPAIAEDEATPDNGGQMVENSQSKDDFSSLVEGIIDDVLDLLGTALSEKIAPEGNMDDLMNGALEMDTANTAFLGLSDTGSLGAQAAYIAKKVYGDDPGDKWVIPQTIYFERFVIKPNTADGTIDRLIRKIQKSKNPDRDKYNLCLNATINLWVTNINRGKSASHGKPKEGVYIRDAEDTLYLYERGGK